MSESDLSLFYTACIRPVMDYAVPVFHYALPNYLSNELERIQRRVLRIICPCKEYHQRFPKLYRRLDRVTFDCHVTAKL